MSSTETKSFGWKASVLYVILAGLFLVAVAAYGYSQGWFKQGGSKAGDMIAATFSSLSSPSQSTGNEDGLSKAREAFAKGDVNNAVEAYRQIVAKSPEDIAARGELGNVLYAVGNVSEAAKVYFEAASIAIDKNQPELAEALLPAIIEGNPNLATQLNDKLFEAQMRSNTAQQPAQQQAAQDPATQQIAPAQQQQMMPMQQPMPMQQAAPQPYPQHNG